MPSCWNWIAIISFGSLQLPALLANGCEVVVANFLWFFITWRNAFFDGSNDLQLLLSSIMQKNSFFKSKIVMIYLSINLINFF